ncbi:MAG: hypothetical protein OXC61_00805 [Flavobacteriaceae bacterium]|nr:hypothetical protein [Flavobacteriaceae bacterium]
MKLVEQIKNGSVVLDHDTRIKKEEIQNFLFQDIQTTNTKNPYTSTLSSETIKLYTKQVTYLGHPHPIYKKRIQISVGWGFHLRDNNAFLIGLYKYEDTVLYVIFDKTNFVNRQTNNSSAHVSTLDLLNADTQGIFTKIDSRNNKITVTTREHIRNVLIKLINKQNLLTKEICLFESFKQTLFKEYNGIECYQKMINSNFRDKFQSEWFGFYVEFEFQGYLEENPKLKDICEYQKIKNQNSLDFDIIFKKGFLGDLKTSSNKSLSILGNDKTAVLQAVDKYKRLWYILIKHDTTKDSECNYEVTQFWNKKQSKDNLMSYSKKMKNRVFLTELQILEITPFNVIYLSDFKQGRQQSDSRRNMKIQIRKTAIDNFLIYYSHFE